MEIVQIAVIVLLLYLAIVILLASIRAWIASRKGWENAKKTFKETFWNCFIEFLGEMLNPFNWL